MTTASDDTFLGIGDPDLYHAPSDTKGFKIDLNQPTERLMALGKGEALKVLFTPLPNTRNELNTIAQYFKKPTLYFKEEATETLTKSLPLSDYPFVSFATHGLLAGEFNGLNEPALVLSPPIDISEQDNGLLTASEIANLSFNADWVILSACNTAGGDGKPGAEGLSGLAKAFFYAGSKTLLVSHWSVDSTATGWLTSTALQHFIENRSASSFGKAEAVRVAMKRLAHEHKTHYAHPAY